MQDSVKHLNARNHSWHATLPKFNKRLSVNTGIVIGDFSEFFLITKHSLSMIVSESSEHCLYLRKLMSHVEWHILKHFDNFLNHLHLFFFLPKLTLTADRDVYWFINALLETKQYKYWLRFYGVLHKIVYSSFCCLFHAIALVLRCITRIQTYTKNVIKYLLKEQLRVTHEMFE